MERASSHSRWRRRPLLIRRSMRTFLALSASPPRLRQSLWMTNCRAASLITRTHARALQPQVNPQWAPLGAQRFKDLLEVSLAAASPFVTLAILSHLPHLPFFPICHTCHSFPFATLAILSHLPHLPFFPICHTCHSFPFATLAILSHLPHSRSFPFGTRHGVF